MLLNIFLNDASPYYGFNLLFALTMTGVCVAGGGILLVYDAIENVKRGARNYRRKKAQSSR